MGVWRVRALLGLILVVVVLASTGPSLPPTPAVAQTGLFTPASRQPSVATGATDPTIVRARYVEVNFPLLDSTARASVTKETMANATLALDLFPAQSARFPAVGLTAVRERLETTTAGQGYIWTGMLQGDRDSRVTLVVEHGVVVGNIRTPTQSFQIRYVGNGVHAIYEINPAAFPEEAGAKIPYTARIGPATRLPRAPTAPTDGAGVIDVGVVYTATVRAAAGGTTAMNNLVDLGMAETNQAYLNSGIIQRVRLVFRSEIAYAETGDATLDLDNLQAGRVPNALAWRDQFGADIVSLWVENGGPYCGVGYLLTPVEPGFQNFAFNAVVRACATGNFTFSHEMGHNMGACHDRVTNDCTPANNYGYGYIASNSSFRTIMSYGQPCNFCPRLQHFSNPNVGYRGLPTGLPGTNDNAQMLNATAATVANFRQCVVAPCGVQPTIGPVSGAPGNDDFASATAVNTFPAQFTSDNTLANVEFQEPQTYSCGQFPAFVGKTVWYTVTPSTTVPVTISTNGSSYDTVLSVWSGTTLSGLTQVACNDDIAGASNRNSQLTFTAAAGQTYRVQVGGYNSGSGPATGSLLVVFSAPTATPTPIPTPTPPPTCNPRPRVNVTTTPSGNRLQVSLTTGGNARLLQLQLGAMTNAVVDLDSLGQTGLGSTTVTLPPETLSLTFYVRRQSGGAASHVNLTVVDGCGMWPTFVGGGASAF